MLSDSQLSCGIRELIGFEEFKTAKQMLLEGLLEDEYLKALDNNITFRFIIFSDNEHKGLSGASFARFVRRNHLGPVTASNLRVNPNSDNKIRVWIWELDIPAVMTWLEEHRDKYDYDDRW